MTCSPENTAYKMYLQQFLVYSDKLKIGLSVLNAGLTPLSLKLVVKLLIFNGSRVRSLVSASGNSTLTDSLTHFSVESHIVAASGCFHMAFPWSKCDGMESCKLRAREPKHLVLTQINVPDAFLKSLSRLFQCFRTFALGTLTPYTQSKSFLLKIKLISSLPNEQLITVFSLIYTPLNIIPVPVVTESLKKNFSPFRAGEQLIWYAGSAAALWV